MVVQPRAHVSVHVNQAHPTRRSGAGAAHRVESPTAAAARADARPARLAADSDTQHAALDAAPAQAMLGAIARRQAAKASAPAAEHPAADAVQRTAGETALPVGQPWLLAIFAIVALAAVSAASAQVVVRRKRS